MTDPTRLEEIRARVDALGIEPWFYIHCQACLHKHTVGEGYEHRRWTAVCAMTYQTDGAKKDAQFIANARADIPWLLTQLDAQAQTIQTLTQERDCLQAVMDHAEHDDAVLIEALAARTATVAEQAATILRLEGELRTRG